MRAEGRALRFEGGHRLALVSLDGDTARLFDEYTERLVEPASRTSRVPVAGVTRVRVVVTLRRTAASRVVVESVDASSLTGRRPARSGSDAGASSGRAVEWKSTLSALVVSSWDLLDKV